MFELKEVRHFNTYGLLMAEKYSSLKGENPKLETFTITSNVSSSICSVNKDLNSSFYSVMLYCYLIYFSFFIYFVFLVASVLIFEFKSHFMIIVCRLL